MEDEGESAGGGFLFFGSGLSGLIGIAAFVAAINNPSDADLRAWARIQIEQEAGVDGNPFVDFLVRAGVAEIVDAMTISSTNYIVFTHFDVTTPDLRLLGGDAPQQVCLIGVMNDFFPCSEVEELLNGSESRPLESNAISPAASESVQADGRSAREIHLANGFNDYGDEPLDRPKGWLCDGARVTFASAGDDPVDEDGRILGSQPGNSYLPYDVTIAGQQSRWILGMSMCSASCNEDNPVSEYLLPLPDSQFSGSEFSTQFGVQFNGRPCEPVE